MIEEVEEVGSETHLHLLSEVEVLESREIFVPRDGPEVEIAGVPVDHVGNRSEPRGSIGELHRYFIVEVRPERPQHSLRTVDRNQCLQLRQIDIRSLGGIEITLEPQAL